MQLVSCFAALLLLLLVGFAGVMLRWGPITAVMRQAFRQPPGARARLIAGGAWIAFSRRFGWPYVSAAFGIATVWVGVGCWFISDNPIGPWLLLVPAGLLAVVGDA